MGPRTSRCTTTWGSETNDCVTSTAEGDSLWFTECEKQPRGCHNCCQALHIKPAAPAYFPRAAEGEGQPKVGSTSLPVHPPTLQRTPNGRVSTRFPPWFRQTGIEPLSAGAINEYSSIPKIALLCYAEAGANEDIFSTTQYVDAVRSSTQWYYLRNIARPWMGNPAHLGQNITSRLSLRRRASGGGGIGRGWRGMIRQMDRQWGVAVYNREKKPGELKRRAKKQKFPRLCL